MPGGGGARRLQSEIAVVVDPVLGDRPGPARLGSTQMLCGAAAFGPDGAPLLPEQGIEAHGPSPYRTTFQKPTRVVSGGLADFDHAFYEPGFRMVPASGARSLARVVEPCFGRSYERFSGHSYTRPDGSRALRRRAQPPGGRWRGAHRIGAGVRRPYGRHAVPEHRRLIGNSSACCCRALIRATDAPSVLQTTVIRNNAATILHLLSLARERRDDLHIVEDALPLVDQPISIRTDRPPRQSSSPRRASGWTTSTVTAASRCAPPCAAATACWSVDDHDALRLAERGFLIP